MAVRNHSCVPGRDRSRLQIPVFNNGRLQGIAGHYRVLLDTTGYCWTLQGIAGHYRDCWTLQGLLDTTGDCWTLQGIAGHYRGLLDTTGDCWTLQGLLDTTGNCWTLQGLLDTTGDCWTLQRIKFPEAILSLWTIFPVLCIFSPQNFTHMTMQPSSTNL